jgi:uncharacterized DUF497 family protein
MPAGTGSRSRKPRPHSRTPLHSQSQIRIIVSPRSGSFSSAKASEDGYLSVVHTERGETIRLITARLVTRSERQAYEEGS